MLGIFVSSTTGLIHLILAILSMALGSYVLFTRKGTTNHRRIGYVYVALMLGTNITALMIYRLSGSFGLFHFFAIWSIFAVFAGMAATVFRRSWRNWLTIHYYFMYWSVIALYAAFVAEMSVRLPGKPFWTMVGVSTAVVSIVSTLAYLRLRTRWDKVLDYVPTNQVNG